MENAVNTEDKKRLLSNFLSLATLQGANYILPLITLPYLVRVLGVEYFGLLAFAGAIIAYFGIFTDYGFNLTATKEISIHRENKEKIIEIFSSVMIIKTLLMFVSFALLSLVIVSFDKFSKDWLVYILTFGTVIGQTIFPIWFFQGMERMKYITYLNILSKSIFTVAIFVFVKEQSDFYVVPLLTSIGAIVAGVVSLWIIRKYFDVRFKWQSKDTLMFYLKDGWDIFVSSFAGNFYRNFNTLVLGFLTNNLFVGYYSIAEKIIKIIQSLQGIVGSVLFPYLSKKISTDENFFFSLNKKYFKYIFSIYVLTVVAVYFIAPYIVYMLNGNYENSIIIDLKVMSIVILIGGMNYYFGILGLVTMGYKKDFSKFIIITAVSNVILAFILVYLFKDIGASLSLILSESILMMLIYNKVIKIKGVI